MVDPSVATVITRRVDFVKTTRRLPVARRSRRLGRSWSPF